MGLRPRREKAKGRDPFTHVNKMALEVNVRKLERERMGIYDWDYPMFVSPVIERRGTPDDDPW